MPRIKLTPRTRAKDLDWRRRVENPAARITYCGVGREARFIGIMPPWSSSICVGSAGHF